jgi:hypothetical protein
MYLIGSASEVAQATVDPTRDEDPFSVLARRVFDRVCAQVLPQRKGARLAVAIANCYGGWTFCDPQIKRLVNDGPGRVSAYLSVAWFPAAAQGRITIKNQLQIPALTFSTEFYAFYDAMRVCRFWLKHGVCDVALAGAAETLGSPFLSSAFGPGVRNDAVAWFAFANEGEERIRLDEEPPPVHPEASETIVDELPRGTPLKGSCALPLLILEARGRRPCTLEIPRRMVVRADPRSVNLWRYES